MASSEYLGSVTAWKKGIGLGTLRVDTFCPSLYLLAEVVNVIVPRVAGTANLFEFEVRLAVCLAIQSSLQHTNFLRQSLQDE